MNKRDLVSAVAKEASVDTGTADRVIEAMMKVVAEAVASGEEVALRNFGVFSRVSRQARTGTNLHTGEPLAIAARHSPKFAPAQALRKQVNGGV